MNLLIQRPPGFCGSQVRRMKISLAVSTLILEESYRLRIAELQAGYRLVPAKGPTTYACNGDLRNEVVVSFFQTQPPTLIAERGDQVSLMYLQSSGSGSKYQGRNESLWEHQGEASIVWGYGSPEMRCSRKP